MIKLLSYLENRALGLHPHTQTNPPLIQGFNHASEHQLLLACRSPDRLAALRIFCRNHPFKYLEDENGQLLIDYIQPEPELWEESAEEGKLLHIACATIIDDRWDTYSQVWINIESGVTFDTSQEKKWVDMLSYLDHRRACCKKYFQMNI